VRIAAVTVLGLWAILVLPFWLLGMGFAGRVVLLPNMSTLQGLAFFTAMYLPPLLGAFLLWSDRRLEAPHKRNGTNAQN
jgi:hypothetical protein